MSFLYKSAVLLIVAVLAATLAAGCTDRNYNDQNGVNTPMDNVNGTNGTNGTNGNYTQQNTGKTRGMNRNMGNTDGRKNMNQRMRIADKAAAQLTKMKGIKQANVLVTNDNAYVACVVDTNPGKLTSELEEQIAQKVRQVDGNVNNVYVSTNPEFVDSINRYATDVANGHPVAGFVDEFNTMIQRIFPNAR